MQELLAVSMQEAARRLGLSVRTVATLISRRELRSRKVGRRRIIPVAALEAFVGMDGKHGRSKHPNVSAENTDTRCGDPTLKPRADYHGELTNIPNPYDLPR